MFCGLESGVDSGWIPVTILGWMWNLGCVLVGFWGGL